MKESQPTVLEGPYKDSLNYLVNTGSTVVALVVFAVVDVDLATIAEYTV